MSMAQHTVYKFAKLAKKQKYSLRKTRLDLILEVNLKLINQLEVGLLPKDNWGVGDF